MAVIYKEPRKPLKSLFQQLLAPSAEGQGFGHELGSSLAQYLSEQQNLKNRQRAMEQDFQQQQALMQAKEQERARQGAAYASIFGGQAKNQNTSPLDAEQQQAQGVNALEGEKSVGKDEFFDKSWPEVAAEAAQTGHLGVKDIEGLRRQWFDEKKHSDTQKHQEKVFEYQKEQVDKRAKEREEEFAERKKESLKRHEEKAKDFTLQEEKDQRIFDRKESDSLIKRGQEARKANKQLSIINKLAQSPEASTGLEQQLLNAFGLGKFGASSHTQVLSKLMSDMINKDPNSKGGIALRNAIEKGSITPEMTKETIGFFSKIGTLNNDKDMLIEDEIRRLRRKAIKENNQPPLFINDIAFDNVKDKWDKLDGEQAKVINDFSNTGEEGIAIPKGAKVGSVMTNPENGEKVVYLGPKMGVKSLQEYEGAIKELESEKPAAKNPGVKIAMDELGLYFVSDGKSWKPLQ